MCVRNQKKDNFKRIFLWQKIDICRFVNEVETYANSMFKRYLIWANETFQGVIHKCPYRILLVRNLTLSLDPSFEIDTIVPNGEIRHRINLYNNKDKNIGTFQIIWKQDLINVI